MSGPVGRREAVEAVTPGTRCVDGGELVVTERRGGTERLDLALATLWRCVRRCLVLAPLLFLGLARALAMSLHHFVRTLADGWGAAPPPATGTPVDRVLRVVRALTQLLGRGSRRLARATARVESASQRADGNMAARLR